MEFKFRALANWPRPFTKNRRNSSFQATYSQTLKLLESELGKLGARNVVIQLALRERDIRLDGLPRADARKPDHPGVVISFDCKQGDLSFMCDEFFDWKDNLRGIAMTLERLRLVDLYGVTKSGEQYRGWAALPAPQSEDFASDQDAATWLSRESGESELGIKLTPEKAKIAYRVAAKKHHPDNGGDPAQFRRLQSAKKLLGI